MTRRTVAGLLFAIAVARGQALDRAKVDAAVAKSMREWGVPGVAVAIVRGDDVLFAHGYGVKELGKDDRVTAKTVFAIGSATKAFTTTAMAMLIDEGKMDWDDPVRKHLEFFHLRDPLGDEMVTMRDLVTHRTGLSRNDLLWYNSPWSSEEIIRKIAFIEPSRPFRSAWQYNNLMFLTAGYAVGKTAGTTWQDFVQKRIFDPLGMDGADCSVTVAERAADRASPHRRSGAKTNVISWFNLDNIQPAGAINASAEDMAKWLRFQLGDGTFQRKRLVSAHNMAEMHTPQMAMRPEEWGREYNPEVRQMSYGLAWFIHDYRGLHLVAHGGAIDGFRATVTMVPDRKVGIVVLSNLDQENMPEALRYNLIDIVLGLPPHDWDAVLKEHFGADEKRQAAAAKRRAESRVANTKPSHDLDAYAGEYTEPAYGAAKVSVENGGLVLSWSRFSEPLQHFHFDVFEVKGQRLDGTPVQFRLGGDGAVRALDFLGVEFERRR